MREIVGKTGWSAVRIRPDLPISSFPNSKSLIEISILDTIIIHKVLNYGLVGNTTHCCWQFTRFTSLRSNRLFCLPSRNRRLSEITTSDLKKKDNLCTTFVVRSLYFFIILELHPVPCLGF
jgi:hypothetical protein